MAVLTRPNESYSITIRVEIENKPGMLGKVTTAIGNAGGDIGAVDLSGHGKGTVTRDITARARGVEHAQEIINAVKMIQGVKVINVSDRTFLMHLGGKIEVRNKIPVKTRNDLSMAY
ncbi:MAG: NAD-dependent malic enzyme, partial [Deltaproteobacteria bacterium 37-65-8]